MFRLLTTICVPALALVALVAPASAQDQGAIKTEVGVGYFYGTFGEDPNLLLLTGGTAEEFCADSPDDPFNAEPGSAPARIIERPDGTLTINVNDRGQPIYLYESGELPAPPWIEGVCADLAVGVSAPEPIATGTAQLKVRDRIVSDDFIDVFNSVTGELVATDGTVYRVRASADLTIVNGVPAGNPEDFVSFELKPIGR